VPHLPPASRRVLTTVPTLVTLLATLVGAMAGPAGQIAPKAVGLAGAVVHSLPKLPPGLRTSGIQVRPVADGPYSGDGLLELDDPERPVDGDGVAVYERDGRAYDHPVVLARYGINAVAGWTATGDGDYLRRAEANAGRLLATATESGGALWFSYPFDYPLGHGGEVIGAPWWSGMAQGQALSLFTRLYQATGDGVWRDAAGRTLRSFSVQRNGDAPWQLYVDEGYAWFEEYAGSTEPLRVLNGQVFALFGLYDYAALTGSATAAALFDAGVTTVKDHFDRFRVEGGVSYYCLRADYCDVGFQNAKYHGIHTHQLATLSRLTRDPELRRMAEQLVTDGRAVG
jgi:hypothetical protein